MEKLFILTMRKLFLIRRLDSLLCALTLILSAFIMLFTAYYEELSVFLMLSVESLYYLTAVPALYLLAEVFLLILYSQVMKKEQREKLDRFRINRYRKIILDNQYHSQPDSSSTLIGNPSSFLSFKKCFLDVETLIKSRLAGIVMALLNIILIIAATLSFSENIWIGAATLTLFVSMLLLIYKLDIED